METKLLIAYITALVTILGWLTVHLLTKRREDRTRKIETMLEHVDRQITDFYGPVFNLIEQMWSSRIVHDQLFRGERASSALSKDDLVKVRIHYWNFFYKPIHFIYNHYIFNIMFVLSCKNTTIYPN